MCRAEPTTGRQGTGWHRQNPDAVEYAYRAREQGRYAHTFWINAASEEAILTSFQLLAERLPGFAARDEQDQHKLIAAILRWLETCPEPWLLIFDNADELPLVQPYLPKQGRGSILLITRASAVSWLAAPIEVEQMGLLEGTRFLLHRTGRLSASDEECNEATNIVIALDGFPLALDQAGAYIEETGCSFGDYLRLYEQHRATLLARRGKQASNYPASVATTWDLSFQKIEQTQLAAAELLCLCAYLAPDHIPEELITQEATHWPPVLQEAVSDTLRFNDLLEALLAFSLIKRLTQERMLSLHRLVQVVLKERLSQADQQMWVTRITRTMTSLFPSDEMTQAHYWQYGERLLPHALACIEVSEQCSDDKISFLTLVCHVAAYLSERAHYSKAQDLLQRAISIGERVLGPEHVLVAEALHHLGMLAFRQGTLAEAELLFQRALRIREQRLGTDHPQVAASLHGLGRLSYRRGKYAEAELLIQQALRIREHALGTDHPLVTATLSTLAILSGKQEKYEQAESLYVRALRIREQALGADHSQVATLLNNLADLYKEQGNYEQAEPLFQRALQIWERDLGPDHPRVAYPLEGLAELYREQGNYEQAESLFQRALQIWEQRLGPDRSMVAGPLHGLALLYTEQKNYEQAESLLQRALQVRRRALGPHHPDTADSFAHLARFHQMQQRFTEALSLYQQALAIREQALGAAHPKTVETRQHLRVVLQALGKTEEAAALEGMH